MISISKPSKKNIMEFDLSDNFDIENSMIILDGKDVAGLTYYSLLGPKEAILEEVIIKPEYQSQYFGDSIVKAILNVADKRGIKRVFVDTDINTKRFFEKVGFLNPADIEVTTDYNIKEETLMAVLPDFFETACRSKK